MQKLRDGQWNIQEFFVQELLEGQCNLQESRDGQCDIQELPDGQCDIHVIYM